MDVLKKLFEQHFHSPVERVQPLQGQLGGSGRKIVRLTAGNAARSAFCMTYAKKTSRSSNFPGIFARTVFPCRKFTPRI